MGRLLEQFCHSKDERRQKICDGMQPLRKVEKNN